MHIDWSTVITGALLAIDYAIKILAIGVVPENRRPGSAHAWLLVILLVPIVGLPLYVILGHERAGRFRDRVVVEAKNAVDALADRLPGLPERLRPDEETQRIMRLNSAQTGLLGAPGIAHGFYPGTHASIARMAELVDAATVSVHVEIYIMAWDHSTDPFFSALARAVQRGVPVRLLMDHIGSLPYPGFRDMGRRLTAAGIDWHVMMPLRPLKGQWRRPDLRNHRKILVVDEERAVMGSMNMIDPSYLKPKNLKAGLQWHDCMVELSGPIVDQIEYVFAVDWYSETHEQLEIHAHDEASARQWELEHHQREAPEPMTAMQLVPSGPGWHTTPNLRLFDALLYRAQRSAVIVSPYFIPEESLMHAITSAALRGVRVELFVSRKADQFMVHHAQRSYYEELLRAGVIIHAYPAPNVLHTKYMTIDDDLAVFGSSNMDMRSFYLDYEVTLMMCGAETVAGLQEVSALYREECEIITPEEWSQRTWAERFLDNALRLTSALQ